MLRLIRTIKTNLIVIPLIKLAYRFELFVFKRAIEISLLLTQKLRYQLRVLTPNAMLEGYDEKFDLIVHLASLKFLRPEIFDDNPPTLLSSDLKDELQKNYSKLKAEYADNKEEVNSLINAYDQNKHIIRIHCNYNLAKHFMASYQGKKDKADYFLARAQKKDPEVLALNNNDLFALEHSLRKDINKLRAEIADRQAIKISLSIEHTGTIISLVSCFFLITGYLYNRFLLGYFGVEVSKYFTISDYLASSIEGVRYSITGAAIGLAAYFIGVHRASRKSYVQIEYERKRKEYWPYGIIFVAIVGTIRGYIDNSVIFYEASYVLIIFIGFWFIPLLATKYFKEPLSAIFVLLFVVAYSAHMFSSVGNAIHRARNYPFEKIQQHDAKFKKELPIDESGLALIAGNSNYLFFLDRRRNAFIIPRDQILYLKVRKMVNKKPNYSIQQAR